MKIEKAIKNMDITISDLDKLDAIVLAMKERIEKIEKEAKKQQK